MNLPTANEQLAVAAASVVAAARAEAASAPDAVLLEEQQKLEASARLIETASAALAAQVADRSLPELARLCHRALDQVAHGLA